MPSSTANQCVSSVRHTGLAPPAAPRAASATLTSSMMMTATESSKNSTEQTCALSAAPARPHQQHDEAAVIAQADAIADPGTVVIELHHAAPPQRAPPRLPVAERAVQRARRQVQTALAADRAAHPMKRPPRPYHAPVEDDRPRESRVRRQQRALAPRGGVVGPQLADDLVFHQVQKVLDESSPRGYVAAEEAAVAVVVVAARGDVFAGGAEVFEEQIDDVFGLNVRRFSQSDALERGVVQRRERVDVGQSARAVQKQPVARDVVAAEGGDVQRRAALRVRFAHQRGEARQQLLEIAPGEQTHLQAVVIAVLDADEHLAQQALRWERGEKMGRYRRRSPADGSARE